MSRDGLARGLPWVSNLFRCNPVTCSKPAHCRSSKMQLRSQAHCSVLMGGNSPDSTWSQEPQAQA